VPELSYTPTIREKTVKLCAGAVKPEIFSLGCRTVTAKVKVFAGLESTAGHVAVIDLLPEAVK
jgi:hypothetical protein